jgi:peptidoglycan/LPS O-acetylase OafA/YrhL
MTATSARARAVHRPRTPPAERDATLLAPGYQPALDGVRAVAIAGVLALHSSIWGAVPAVLPGGDLGVQVFFVLSGYLITTRLVIEHARSGDIDLRSFYMRRAARLLPPLLVLLPIYTAIFSSQLGVDKLTLTVGAALLYASSIVQAVWGAMGNLGWTWSLSVEEYFYAVWPLLLRRLLRAGRSDSPPQSSRAGIKSRPANSGRPRLAGHAPRLPRRARRWVTREPLLCAAALAALAAMLATALRIALAGSFYWNAFGYYSPFTRFGALAFGCLAALLAARLRVRVPPAAGWGALAAIAWCYARPQFAIGRTELQTYGLSLAALAAAALIVALAGNPRSRLARLLSLRPIAHVGRISYGLYVWNLMPGQTFRLLSGHHPGPAGTVALGAIMIVLVELSYWRLEQPCMRWARRRLAGARFRQLAEPSPPDPARRAARALLAQPASDRRSCASG